MPDSSTVYDIATPRRTIGGRCCKWCISAQPASNKQHVSNSGATVKPTNTTYMHIVSSEVSVMIMSRTQSLLIIRKELMQSPANGTPSPEQHRIRKYYSFSLRIRIKPQQLRHLLMSGICLDVKRLFAWTKRYGLPLV